MDRLAAVGFNIGALADAASIGIPSVAATTISRAALADGAWARPDSRSNGHVAAALAAILKKLGQPKSVSHVRMAAALAMHPYFLTPLLQEDIRAEWMRLVGQEATPRTGNVIDFRTRVIDPWGETVRTFRGNGWLVEDRASGTWAKGTGRTNSTR